MREKARNIGKKAEIFIDNETNIWSFVSIAKPSIAKTQVHTPFYNLKTKNIKTKAMPKAKKLAMLLQKYSIFDIVMIALHSNALLMSTQDIHMNRHF